jgi:OmpA-OmpF porin, OOP family
LKKTALVLALAGTATLLQAQEGTKWVDLQTAYVTQNGKWRGIDVKDTVGVGLGLGTWLTDRWGLEGSLLAAELKSKSPVPTVKGREMHAFASALFNLAPGDHTFYPYLRAGLGASAVGTAWSQENRHTTRFQYHGGVGVQGFFAEHLLANAEARVVRIDTPTARTELMGLLGIGYRWGTAQPAAAALPPPPPPTVEEIKPVTPPPPPPPPLPSPVEENKPAAAVASLPPPPPPLPPAKIVLDQAVLHFANSRSELSPEGVTAVQKVAEELKTYPGEYSLVVSGHTSSVGSKAFNKALSKRRADAVAKVLVESGIPAASVETVGMGPDQPIADNKSAEGQARNRRVEIDVKVMDGSVEKRTIQTGTQDSPIPTPKKKKKVAAPK